jgi:hypothetical protein
MNQRSPHPPLPPAPAHTKQYSKPNNKSSTTSVAGGAAARKRRPTHRTLRETRATTALNCTTPADAAPPLSAQLGRFNVWPAWLKVRARSSVRVRPSALTAATTACSHWVGSYSVDDTATVLPCPVCTRDATQPQRCRPKRDVCTRRPSYPPTPYGTEGNGHAPPPNNRNSRSSSSSSNNNNNSKTNSARAETYLPTAHVTGEASCTVRVPAAATAATLDHVDATGRPYRPTLPNTARTLFPRKYALSTTTVEPDRCADSSQRAARSGRRTRTRCCARSRAKTATKRERP